MFSLTGLRLERAKASPQFRNGRFWNTAGVSPSIDTNSFALMGDLLFGGKERRPSAPLPVESPLAAWGTPVSSGLRVTWFGHSTLLLESKVVRVLIDPVFGNYASPGFFAGRRRFHPVPASIGELPPLDVVLLSHDHYDHLNSPTIRSLAKLRVPFITSLGVGARLEKLGVDASLITELDWWEEHTLPGGTMTFTAAPAQHFSGRGLRDRNITLWSSWIITTANKRVFFSADTGLTDELAVIGQRFGPFDLSMIEIGASNPAWADIHLGPVNAMRAFEMLGGGTLLPIHWGTFDLALHAWDEPAETLVSIAEKNGARVLTPRLGRPIEPDLVEDTSRWWREVNGRNNRERREFSV
jgi:L-ascorbate metabolism protein UlaG (beta-lactamase superfamily)